MNDLVYYEYLSKVKVDNLEKLHKYCTEKGYNRFDKMAKILFEHSDYVTDEDLHNYDKYDILLRRVLYEYITLFEINLRAILTNEDKSLDYDEMSLGSLIHKKYKGRPEFSNLEIIKELRNSVMHFSILYPYKELKTDSGIFVTVESAVNTLLEQLQMNFPNFYTKKFVDDINRLQRKLPNYERLVINFG